MEYDYRKTSSLSHSLKLIYSEMPRKFKIFQQDQLALCSDLSAISLIILQLTLVKTFRDRYGGRGTGTLLS